MKKSPPFYESWVGKNSLFMSELKTALCSAGAVSDRLEAAMAYSVNAGGKRFRPYLMHAVAHSYGGNAVLVAVPAAAVELAHTYSLIHDDLPGMDDDDFRRGQPSNHKVFGEGMAILAGDALQTRAFEFICSERYEGLAGAALALRLARRLAESIGANGMAGGQALDLEGGIQDEAGLNLMHGRKTGALIEYCCEAGSLVSGCDGRDAAMLGRQIGLAFQVRDDIMDATYSKDQMGKTPGKDLEQGKSTFVSLFGIEGAKRILAAHVEKARIAAGKLPGDTEPVLYAIDMMNI